MNCDVIQDLIPLYIDGCCSAESAGLVEEHVKTCGACRECLENAGRPLAQAEAVMPPKLRRISAWKASILQSVLFLLYFAVITFGVAMEAYTPSGLMNSFWAFNFEIPATGFLLSLINWYFIRLYSSRRSFVLGSLICTAAATLCCFLWGAYHYELPLTDLELLFRMAFGYNLMGTVFAGINLILSAVLSGVYAKMTGKE